MNNMQKEDKLVRRHKKKIRNGFKIRCFDVQRDQKEVESFRVRKITFLLQPFEMKKENV